MESSGLVDDVSEAFEGGFDGLNTSSVSSVVKSLSSVAPRYTMVGENQLNGNCGGTLVLSEQGNKTTVTLTNFCDNAFFTGTVLEEDLTGLEVTVNGVIEHNWSETDTKDTEHLVLKDFSMTAVSGLTDVLDIQVGGNVLDVDSYSGDVYLGNKATYNLVMKENLTGLKFKMENLIEDFSYDVSNNSNIESFAREVFDF